MEKNWKKGAPASVKGNESRALGRKPVPVNIRCEHLIREKGVGGKEGIPKGKVMLMPKNSFGVDRFFGDDPDLRAPT